MEPTRKSYKLNQTLSSVFGFDREDSIRNNQCVPPPIGCGRTIDPDTEFKDEISRKEFCITGMCQKCQDKVF